jgi:hydrogenase-1 operon protein HyaF
VADVLGGLIGQGRGGSIDLLGLPLSAECLAAVEGRLGDGEVSATLNVSGESVVRETAFPGVWWTRHADETGRVTGLLIEVADVPEILRASLVDIQAGQLRLRETVAR